VRPATSALLGASLLVALGATVFSTFSTGASPFGGAGQSGVSGAGVGPFVCDSNLAACVDMPGADAQVGSDSCA
jgi:hypothetical protein